MQQSPPQPSGPASCTQETYTMQGQSSYMNQRSAQKQAQFFLPKLRSNMSLLDCGCGPGSITCGLAAVVAPGEAIGIDIDEDDVGTARARAAAEGLSNCRFETASVYELPFADGSFDAVFSHALLEHLRDPLAALQEMYRVLKPGGVVGVRSPDFAGHVSAPLDPLVERMDELYERLSRHNGGNPRIGKHLRALLRDAGFANIESSASYDMWPRNLPSLSHIHDQLLKLGWIDLDESERISDAWQRWLGHPDFFAARAFCEGVGYKE
jgi:ubiquinone/menaquinone biosynthesis C-methylase UbiE